MEFTPFSTIESAEEFLELLSAEAEKAQAEMAELLQEDQSKSPRRVEALRLVIHKLTQLQTNTQSSLRLLNDLRSLRTLLLR